MEFDLRSAIDSLDTQQVFDIANGARPAADYLFNSILPSRNENSYYIDEGSMTIKTTMAGMSGMDSRYAPGGAVSVSEFSGQTGKLTITAGLNEKMLRTLQEFLARQGTVAASTQFIQSNALNFTNKMVAQALLDREEWLKGQALFTGALAWTFNGKSMVANYGVPAANFLSQRTGNDAWDETTSKFWEDIAELQRVLKYEVEAYIAHPDTVAAVLGNAEVNKIELVRFDQNAGRFTIRKFQTIAGNTVRSTDPRDEITLIAYGKEAEILNAGGGTTTIPFCPSGAILAIGRVNNDNVFRIGQGSTEEPAPFALGYGHVAPTVEGGGRPGRWSRVYVPEKEPWQFIAEGAENFLPVIEEPTLIAVASSEINGA